MATQRYISTSFWDDEWVSSLDPSEKLLYMYLMTNTLTNIAGVYKIAIRRICFDTGFNDEMVKKILKRFQDDKKAFLYSGYMILPSWPKHQRWQDKPTIKKGIDSVLCEIPEDVKQLLVNIGYCYPIIGYIQEPSYLDSDLDIDLDTDTDTDISENPTGNKTLKEKQFRKPTLEQVQKYCEERNNNVDHENYWNTYQSQGWIKANGLKIKNWKNHIVTCEKNGWFIKIEETKKENFIMASSYDF